MARNIIKSNNVVVGVQDSANAFKTTNSNLKLYKLVQDYNYSIQLPHGNLKQLGAQGYTSQDLFQHPDVELGFSYIPEPLMSNEQYGKFITTFPTSRFLPMFSGTLENDTNFYVLITENQQDDALDDLTFDTLLNLTGWNAIAFGNCFPTTYGLSYSVGTFPIVSTNYICSNVAFENLTGTSMLMPAIDLTGGNNDNVGHSRFRFEEDSSDDSNPPIPNPTNTGSNVTLQNLQVGGQNLSGIHFIQSLDMSVDLPRVSSYGLGNNFAYTRKAQLPANGRFSVSSLVSGLESGILTGVLKNDENYDFQLEIEASGRRMIYQIEDAKLGSYNYGMSVNGQMSFDAEFSFSVTEKRGLKISGESY